MQHRYVLAAVEPDYTPSNVAGSPTRDVWCSTSVGKVTFPTNGRTKELGNECGAQWYRMNRPRPEMKVYCDMEEDGGGWTLVMHEVMSGASRGGLRMKANLQSGLEWDYSAQSYPGEKEDRLLNPESKKSSKMPDDYINNIRTRKNQLSSIGYRTTSNNFKTRYFHHEDCFYSHSYADHNPRHGSDYNSPYHPCYRFTTKIDAAQDDWVQCLQGTFNAGGIHAYWECGHDPAKGNVRIRH